MTFTVNGQQVPHVLVAEHLVGTSHQDQRAVRTVDGVRYLNSARTDVPGQPLMTLSDDLSTRAKTSGVLPRPDFGELLHRQFSPLYTETQLHALSTALDGPSGAARGAKLAEFDAARQLSGSVRGFSRGTAVTLVTGAAGTAVAYGLARGLEAAYDARGDAAQHPARTDANRMTTGGASLIAGGTLAVATHGAARAGSSIASVARAGGVGAAAAGLGMLALGALHVRPSTDVTENTSPTEA